MSHLHGNWFIKCIFGVNHLKNQRFSSNHCISLLFQLCYLFSPLLCGSQACNSGSQSGVAQFYHLYFMIVENASFHFLRVYTNNKLVVSYYLWPVQFFNYPNKKDQYSLSAIQKNRSWLHNGEATGTGIRGYPSCNI